MCRVLLEDRNGDGRILLKHWLFDTDGEVNWPDEVHIRHLYERC
jgi:hypothetical protein